MRLSTSLPLPALLLALAGAGCNGDSPDPNGGAPNGGVPNGEDPNGQDCADDDPQARDFFRDAVGVPHLAPDFAGDAVASSR